MFTRIGSDSLNYSAFRMPEGLVYEEGVISGDAELLATQHFDARNTTQTQFRVKLTLPADGTDLNLLIAFKNNY